MKNSFLLLFGIKARLYCSQRTKMGHKRLFFPSLPFDVLLSIKRRSWLNLCLPVKNATSAPSPSSWIKVVWHFFWGMLVKNWRKLLVLNSYSINHIRRASRSLIQQDIFRTRHLILPHSFRALSTGLKSGRPLRGCSVQGRAGKD